jgi:hypothetical protein
VPRYPVLLELGKIPAEPRTICRLNERQLQFRFGDFVSMREEIFDSAVLPDKHLRGFFSDSIDAWNVIRRISHETHDLYHSVRRHTEALFHIFGFKHLFFESIIDLDVRSNELKDILITRNDRDVHTFSFCFSGQCSDHIVSLLTFPNEDRDAKRLHHPVDIGDLGNQVPGHGGTVRFVLLEFNVPSRRPLRVKGNC